MTSSVFEKIVVEDYHHLTIWNIYHVGFTGWTKLKKYEFGQSSDSIVSMSDFTKFRSAERTICMTSHMRSFSPIMERKQRLRGTSVRHPGGWRSSDGSELPTSSEGISFEHRPLFKFLSARSGTIFTNRPLPPAF